MSTNEVSNDKPRCQSCGMPISESFGNLGTMGDGSFHQEYCSICFKDGAFVQPEQTLQQMIDSSIANMTGELGMPQEQAEQLANSFIPTLKRWQ
ncbi:zinc ribbon domain-containing protein [Aliikangiella coralliicola]|uniref:Transcriptional regulator n=1 Tax=Aliikangiella coralliicola TaxID=2592383 RepID=A0A545U7I3_9GAMM|nr:zinc ribbon domain-containing protein [Aliikangiella coralliicola]TQV85421.1 transcriptional regulator [Aliikangiella coralliicola]